MPVPPDNPADPSGALLAAAGLPVSVEEAAGFTAAYPALRAQADALYAPAFDGVSPAIGFSAAFPGPALGPAPETAR